MYNKGAIMDRRIKYTKKVLKETLLNILEKKDISKISVTEICTEADINRGTFYRYYNDVYDLLKGIKIIKINYRIVMTIIIIYFIYKEHSELLEELSMIILKAKLYINKETRNTYENIIKEIKNI